MIWETVVTTRSSGGRVHIAPMGIRESAEGRVVLAPFRPSTTLENVLATRVAVVNFTDDVRVIAGCLTGRPDWPTVACERVECVRLDGALAHRELALARIDDDGERPRLHCAVVFAGNHRPFRGFNRAQAAVVEAAILVSRLHMLPGREDRRRDEVPARSRREDRRTGGARGVVVARRAHRGVPRRGDAMTRLLASVRDGEEAADCARRRRRDHRLQGPGPRRARRAAAGGDRARHRRTSPAAPRRARPPATGRSNPARSSRRRPGSAPPASTTSSSASCPALPCRRASASCGASRAEFRLVAVFFADRGVPFARARVAARGRVRRRDDRYRGENGRRAAASPRRRGAHPLRRLAREAGLDDRARRLAPPGGHPPARAHRAGSARFRGALCAEGRSSVLSAERTRLVRDAVDAALLATGEKPMPKASLSWHRGALKGVPPRIVKISLAEPSSARNAAAAPETTCHGRPAPATNPGNDGSTIPAAARAAHRPRSPRAPGTT